MKRCLGLLGCLAIAGCASTGRGGGDAAKGDTMGRTGDAVQSAARQTYRGLGEAVTSPLRDLNLTRQEIPVVLLAAKDAPYQTRTVFDCQSIAMEVAALDLTLGPDLDAPTDERNRDYYRLGADEAAEAALEAARDAAEGLVPFRSWVRQLSGAKSNEKRVKEAIYAGSVRRAFLKGIGEHRGCAAPAAPLDPPYQVAAEALAPELPGEPEPLAMGDAAPEADTPAAAPPPAQTPAEPSPVPPPA